MNDPHLVDPLTVLADVAGVPLSGLDDITQPPEDLGHGTRVP